LTGTIAPRLAFMTKLIEFSALCPFFCLLVHRVLLQRKLNMRVPFKEFTEYVMKQTGL